MKTIKKTGLILQLLCTSIILTAQDDFEETSFEKIIPPKRRRVSYRVSENEICFVITRGLSEIYDILTHVTFLNIEANKIFQQAKDREGNFTNTWKELEGIVNSGAQMTGDDLDHALWNLSIILGRTFHETKDTYENLEKYNPNSKLTNVLFHIIYHLGKRIMEEQLSREYIQELFYGINAKTEEINNYIKKHLVNWDFERLAALDRIIMQIAIYELIHCEDTPGKVAIDEAVELCKLYGTNSSQAYVNAILDKVFHEEDEQKLRRENERE